MTLDEAHRHPGLIAVVARTGHTAYFEFVVRYPWKLAEVLAHPGFPEVTPAQEQERTTALARDLGLLKLAELCLYRGEQIQGGCSCTHVCHAGRGPELHRGEVTRQDCLVCLRSAMGPGS